MKIAFVHSIAFAISLMAGLAEAADSIYMHCYLDSSHQTKGIKRKNLQTGAEEVVSSYVPYVPSNLTQVERIYSDGDGPAYFFDIFSTAPTVVTVYKVAVNGGTYTTLPAYSLPGRSLSFYGPVIKLSDHELALDGYVFDTTANTLTTKGASNTATFCIERGTRNILTSTQHVASPNYSTLDRVSIDTGEITPLLTLPSVFAFMFNGTGGNGYGYSATGESGDPPRIWNYASDSASIVGTTNLGYSAYSAASEFMVYQHTHTPFPPITDCVVIRYSNSNGAQLAQQTLTGFRNPWVSQLPDKALFITKDTGTVAQNGALFDNFKIITINDQNQQSTSELSVQTAANGAQLRGVGPDLAGGMLVQSADGTKLYDISADRTYAISVDIATGDRTRIDLATMNAISTNSAIPAIGSSLALSAGPSIRAFVDYLTGKEKVRHGSEASLDKNDDLGLDAGDLQTKENEH
ncbi:hypothetical protein BH09SUM1_BH09SUM1_06590 [soil metagenome]